MFSKYEEMLVIKKTIENYNTAQKRMYESILVDLKKQMHTFSLDITSDDTLLEMAIFQSNIFDLVDYRKKYKSSLNVLKELDKALMCYHQAYSEEQLQPGGIAEQQAKLGNKIFYEIRTKNKDYKEIMEEIFKGLLSAQDSYITNLEMGFDAKEESLNRDFKNGKITKEQLIYYTNMCLFLSQNEDFMEYVNPQNKSFSRHK